MSDLMRTTLVFQSQAMLQVIEQARRYARSSATVLITGESGTGKELLARFLHEHSARLERPYVRVNCAALSETLIESELFGHERGAFTGADAVRRGRFEAAEGGTLFLDEVGEVSRRAQAKLLRALEEEEYERVGSNETRRLNARVVASTNRDLGHRVQARRFRADLYYRLNVLRLHVPPLRDRREDIPPLVQHFVRRFGGEAAIAVRGVTHQSMHRLCDHDWPGNIRELRNIIQRACVLADAPLLEIQDIPRLPDPTQSRPTADFDTLPLEEIERRVILTRLERCNGNKTAAAAELGVTSRTLRNKLQRYRRIGQG
jgi:DNA-binding NtrC family response regulator